LQYLNTIAHDNNVRRKLLMSLFIASNFFFLLVMS